VPQTARDPWQSVVAASCVSGVASTALECPLEIMAIQLQTQHARAIEGQVAAGGENFTCSLHAFNASRRAHYATELRYGHEGLRDAFTSMLRHRSFYLGVSPLLCKNLVWFTATFGTYEQTKALASRISFNDDSKKAQQNLSIGWKILCGASSGVVAWTSCFPLEVVKANVMGQPLGKQYRVFQSTFACIRQLYSEGGIARLYRGLTPTLVRALPAYTIVLNTYDWMRHKLGCT
jgi:hypothetical protein